ncbi:MAG: methyltransferase domain-containing protein [Coxiellaceae bacterium]|nr:methyltransferase domain-containing protein [Coxiellaceae bacterium]
MSRHLDLGCGRNPRNPYDCDELFGLDQSSWFVNAEVRDCQLGLEAFPYPSDYFDSVSAYDLLEHIPRQSIDYANNKIHFPFLELMSEVWRVLKPDGKFIALTPSFPAKQAFQDPTHVNFISDGTHSYFCGNDPHAARYGFTGRFEAIQVRFVLPEEMYGKLTIRLQWRKFRRKYFSGVLSHLLWELVAKKNQKTERSW